MSVTKLFAPTDTFVHRHIGPSDADITEMLEAMSLSSLDELIEQTIPEGIRFNEELAIENGRGEAELIAELKEVASNNEVYRSFIGTGYYGCITPPIIGRNVLENPGWYTQYTPYQAEIAQGRLEALLNFQSMVADLSGLPLANSSLLDEATAAAEAMALCHAVARGRKKKFYAAEDCHPQSLAVLQTRAEPLGIEIMVCSTEDMKLDDEQLFGVLLQYPGTDGRVIDYSDFCEKVHAAGAMVVMACDLLAMTLIKSPGEVGADVAIGTTQRFGVPMGFGGPHAAFLSTSEKYKRQIPGRIIGVSKDARGRVAYRLALQTREQHIRREKATSNICTAQVLLAIMASMYAVYHGPDGLRRIAERVAAMTRVLRAGLVELGYQVGTGPVFDTLRLILDSETQAKVLAAALAKRINLRVYEDGLGLSLDETCTDEDLDCLLEIFALDKAAPKLSSLMAAAQQRLPKNLVRERDLLTHEVFSRYHSEHELLRYLNRLQSKDLSLTTSMIPLGSCTMKLNGTSEMLPVSWPEFANLHPFVPVSQAAGYKQMTNQLETWLANITGLAAVSLQPNSGAQGEFAGLLAIRAFHESQGQGHRNICLIPVSAHGTNPASAVMAGYKVVAIKCDLGGNIDVEDLRAKAAANQAALAAIMVTYPSTHGVFEGGIREMCEIVHEHGGRVYLDGANMNAQVGLCRPGDYGADVIHLNLHKTFAIPHGGGGPGVGPIAVSKELAPFLPGNPAEGPAGAHAMGPVSAAHYGSASVLAISWMYVALMGGKGLKRATEVAILNANYMAAKLGEHYNILYTGANGRVAHEFIVDFRPFKKSAGVEIDDVAKRLMDYGFHAPTMSFPVPGTLMIEPTESECRAELDRFCNALIGIRGEIREIEEGRMGRDDNPLKHAPHSATDLLDWDRDYDRELGAYPALGLQEHKYWPPVSRIDNAYGDRNLICTCVGMDEL